MINCLLAGNGVKSSSASSHSVGSRGEMVPFNQHWKLAQLQNQLDIATGSEVLLLLAAVSQEQNGGEAPVLAVSELSVMLLVVSLYPRAGCNNPGQCLCAAPRQGGNPIGINFSLKVGCSSKEKGGKGLLHLIPVFTPAHCEIVINCILVA